MRIRGLVAGVVAASLVTVVSVAGASAQAVNPCAAKNPCAVKGAKNPCAAKQGAAAPRPEGVNFARRGGASLISSVQTP
jgi:hypothetical protein